MAKEIKKLGNWGGFSQSRTVYSGKGLCPTLIAGMSHGNTVPYIVVKAKDETLHCSEQRKRCEKSEPQR